MHCRRPRTRVGSFQALATCCLRGLPEASRISFCHLPTPQNSHLYPIIQYSARLSTHRSTGASRRVDRRADGRAPPRQVGPATAPGMAPPGRRAPAGKRPAGRSVASSPTMRHQYQQRQRHGSQRRTLARSCRPCAEHPPQPGSRSPGAPAEDVLRQPSFCDQLKCTADRTCCSRARSRASRSAPDQGIADTPAGP